MLRNLKAHDPILQQANNGNGHGHGSANCFVMVMLMVMVTATAMVIVWYGVVGYGMVNGIV